MHRLILGNTSVPAGNTVANTAARTAFADQAIAIVPNADIATGNGRAFRIKAFGYLSSKSATPGTLALKIVYTNTGSTTELGAATFALPASLTNAGWTLEAIVRIATTTTQATSKLAAQGFALLDSAGVPLSAGLVNVGSGTAGQITVTNGTGGNQNITLGLAAQFSLADPANTVTLADCGIEALA